MHRLDHRVHRYIDYAAIAFFLLAPGVFGFAGVSAPLAYALALVYLALALATAYPGGGLWRLPFKLHGRVELVAAAAAIASPWLFNFGNDTRARNFFVLVGAGTLTVWLMSDYRAPDPAPMPTDRVGDRAN